MKIGIKGRVKIELFDKDGNLKAIRYGHNILTTYGMKYVADRIIERSMSAMSHMAIGSDDTTPTVSDTALGNELARSGFTSTYTTNNEVTYYADFAVGEGTGDIKEAGIFDASSGGNMMCRLTFSTVTKGANDVMRFTWTHTYENS